MYIIVDLCSRKWSGFICNWRPAGGWVESERRKKEVKMSIYDNVWLSIYKQPFWKVLLWVVVVGFHMYSIYSKSSRGYY